MIERTKLKLFSLFFPLIIIYFSYATIYNLFIQINLLKGVIYTIILFFGFISFLMIYELILQDKGLMPYKKIKGVI